MTVLIPLVAFALLTLVLAFWAFQGGPKIRNLADLQQQAVPIDLRLLMNLVDPVQEQFLRDRLTKRQFFQFKVMRFRAASRYIAAISRDAALSLSIGRSAAKSSSTETALAGRHLADAARRVWLFAPLARLSLAVQILLPRPFGTLRLLMRDYRRIKAGVLHLSDLESSSQTVLRYL